MAIQSKFDATKSFYAYVGAGDLAVEKLRKVATDLHGRLEDVRGRGVSDTVVGRLDALSKDAKEAQTKIEGRFAELQTELPKQAEARFAELKALPDRLEALLQELQTDELTAKAQKTAAELQNEAKSLLSKFEAKAGELRAELNETLTEQAGVFADLATRGESRIAKLRDDSISGDVEILDDAEPVRDVTIDAQVEAAVAAEAAANIGIVRPTPDVAPPLTSSPAPHTPAANKATGITKPTA